MPIKPENLRRYPPDWKHIAAAIRERAAHRCEWEGCKARNYSFGHWTRSESGLMIWCPAHDDDSTPATYAEARQAAAEWDWQFQHLGVTGRCADQALARVCGLLRIPKSRSFMTKSTGWCRTDSKEFTSKDER